MSRVPPGADRAWLWAVAVAAFLVATVVVAVPVWLIQPFAPQTPAGIAWSWRLRQVAPHLTTLAAFVVLAAALMIWRRPVPSRARRVARGVGLVVLVALTLGVTWFARQNHFEWMFRPFPDPRFVAAAEAGDVAATAPVIGVAAGGAALAFPITRLGYHHLVNATLGDVPIVATY